MENDEDIARAWTSYQVRDHDNDNLGWKDSEWWSLEALWGLIKKNPERAFRVIEIIVATDDERVLGMVGASLLEDLFQTNSGSKFALLVIRDAGNDWRWRLALGNMWTHGFKDRKLAELLEESKVELWPDGRP